VRTEYTPDVPSGTAFVLAVLNLWVVMSECKFTYINNQDIC